MPAWRALQIKHCPEQYHKALQCYRDLLLLLLLLLLCPVLVQEHMIEWTARPFCVQTLLYMHGYRLQCSWRWSCWDICYALVTRAVVPPAGYLLPGDRAVVPPAGYVPPLPYPFNYQMSPTLLPYTLLKVINHRWIVSWAKSLQWCMDLNMSKSTYTWTIKAGHTEVDCIVLIWRRIIKANQVNV